MKKRFLTRFDTIKSNSQSFNKNEDLLDEEGFLPLHMRFDKITLASSISKAFHNGLNDGYRKHLDMLEAGEGSEEIIEALSTSRYDDLELQQAYINGFKQASRYFPSENHGSDFSENPQTLSADGENSESGSHSETPSE